MKINILGKDLCDIAKFTKEDYEYIKIIAANNTIKVYTVVSNIEILKNIRGEVFEDGSIIIKPIILSIIPYDCITITDNKIESNTTTINYETVDDKELSYKSFDEDEVLVEKLSSKKRNEILEIKYALPKDDCRPILKNIYLAKNKVVALDGYRMAIRTTNLELTQDILIPMKVIKILSKLKGEGDICKQGNYIIFKINDYSVKFYNSDEKYIEFENLIPKESSIKLDLNSKNILSVLKRAIKLSSYYSDMCTLSLFNRKNNALTISLERLDIKFKEIVTSSCDGELTLGFNMKYLMESLKHFNGDISIELRDPVSPILIKYENKIDLLLPMRLATK